MLVAGVVIAYAVEFGVRHVQETLGEILLSLKSIEASLDSIDSKAADMASEVEDY